MVVFHNRYMVLEMVASHGLRLADVKITHNDVVTAIHESLLANFGEYGLAACLPSLQGTLDLYFEPDSSLYLLV
jgi:RNase P/RNase MRP subunit POP5